MVKTSNFRREIELRRIVQYLRNVVEGSLKDYIFEPNDELTRRSIHRHLQPVFEKLKPKYGCRILPQRYEKRKEMDEASQIIDILEEEIEFRGGKNKMEISIELTPVESLSTVELNFVVK